MVQSRASGGKDGVSKDAANSSSQSATSSRPTITIQDKPAKQRSNAPVYATLARVREMINSAKQVQDEQFKTIKAEIKAELSKIDDIPKSSQLFWGGATIILAIIGLFIGVITIAGDRWDNGLSNGTAIGVKMANTENRIEETNRSISALSDKMDLVLKRLDSDAKTK
jgi:hypothetical protein